MLGSGAVIPARSTGRAPVIGLGENFSLYRNTTFLHFVVDIGYLEQSEIYAQLGATIIDYGNVPTPNTMLYLSYQELFFNPLCEHNLETLL